MNRTTILLTGAQGQVGWELQKTLSPLGTVVAHDRRTLGLGDLDALRRAVRAAAPAVIVNAAAYTQVDHAESEPALAQRINADAPALLAEEARASGALLVHYSTDYVFDGLASRPYREDDAPAPVTVYGRTKYAGDMAVLNSGAAAFIFRVGWVYGLRGTNFLRTIQRLAAEPRELRIVADQHGAPTWCRSIAETTASAVSQILAGRQAGAMSAPPGVYHMAPPDATTWHGFAEAIVNATVPVGRRPKIQPIGSAEYPTPARRPRWSVLDSQRLQDRFGLRLAPWREQLASCLVSGALSS